MTLHLAVAVRGSAAAGRGWCQVWRSLESFYQSRLNEPPTLVSLAPEKKKDDSEQRVEYRRKSIGADVDVAEESQL